MYPPSSFLLTNAFLASFPDGERQMGHAVVPQPDPQLDSQPDPAAWALLLISRRYPTATGAQPGLHA